ncbi:hypothetical protein EDB81DRAFT_900111 [Dactylonectria macrodidyma]|uniref:Uncharacterized protein n=1 Tax=Dactylonectria macrodidyma TaxID=307937 RepID=A0A9P9EN44_9HYPO|nr:hypothetical protein EDB81DRAFT_900111 [Dactylonectria macrodidyma]
MAFAPNIGDLTEWSLEIDFLVAKEISGSPSWESGDNDLRWACPAFEPNPAGACAKYCAEKLQEFAMPQVYITGGIGFRQNAAEDSNFVTLEEVGSRTALPPSMCSWVCSPSPNAISLPTSPKTVDWVGVRLRNPFKPFEALLPSSSPLPQGSSSESSYASSRSRILPQIAPSPPPKDWAPLEMEKSLGVLRRTVKMHSNSTCQVKIHYTLRPWGFDLSQAKKVLTICRIMEPELLLTLRPKVQDPERNHFLPITKSSNIAKFQAKFPEGYMSAPPDECKRRLGQTRPKSGPQADEMDQHIPTLNDSCLQEHLQLIWGATSLSELAGFIKSPDGETAIAIHAPEGNLSPTMEFRYAVWHPQAEGMAYWLRLIGRMFFFAMESSYAEFKFIVAEVAKNASTISQVDEEERWKTLLTYNFDNTMCFHWGHACRQNQQEGGCLSPVNLDCQGILEVDPRFVCISVVERDSESSGSDSYPSTRS